MVRALFTHRWSTFTLLGVTCAVSALAYLSGRQLGSKRAEEAGVSANRARPAPARAPVRPAAPNGDDARSLVAEAASFDAWWARWSNAPRTPATERQMAASLEELAVRDPQRAMSLALSEGNIRLRQSLRHAVLRGWASAAPDAAAAWALALPDGERQISLEAVFSGAARHPEDALRLGQRLCAQDPESAGDYGQFLITALTEAGAYESAARFAATDASAHHSAWLNAAFFQWATHQPQQALSAFGAISDPAARNSAFQGMVLGWAMANPATLATYAMQMAPGEDRAQALGQALPQWVGRDTVLASEWINQLEPSPDLDAGVAAVATLPNLVSKCPEIAVGWAESIAEPVLRANTLRAVAQQWARQDAEALRQFLSATTNLRAADRTALLDGLNPPPDS